VHTSESGIIGTFTIAILFVPTKPMNLAAKRVPKLQNIWVGNSGAIVRLIHRYGILKKKAHGALISASAGSS
jgi:hypothetical protein